MIRDSGNGNPPPSCIHCYQTRYPHRNLESVDAHDTTAFWKTSNLENRPEYARISNPGGGSHRASYSCL